MLKTIMVATVTGSYKVNLYEGKPECCTVNTYNVIMWPVSDPLIMIKEQEMLRLHQPHGMYLNLDYSCK